MAILAGFQLMYGFSATGKVNGVGIMSFEVRFFAFALLTTCKLRWRRRRSRDPLKFLLVLLILILYSWCLISAELGLVGTTTLSVLFRI